MRAACAIEKNAAKLSKHEEGSDGFLKTVGFVVWDHVLSAPEKQEVKDDFTRWKETNARNEIREPLGEDTEE